MEDHGVPSLPVHDSLIVPATEEETAKRVLTAQFTRVVGIVPQLRVNRPWVAHQTGLKCASGLAERAPAY